MKNEEEFYEKCSKILGIEHKYRRPYSRRTRWNARVSGNGRYPGFGLIQSFGSFVRVASRQGTYCFKTYEEVYDFCRKYSEKQT